MIATTAPNGRTEWTLCVCRNGKHSVADHVRHASPIPPPAVVVDRYPTGHVLERRIDWTPWRAA